MRWKFMLRHALFGLLALIVASTSKAAEDSPRPLRIVVMDPLCDRLACDCVAGYAQRNYGKLADYLERGLSCPVEIAYTEHLASPLAGASDRIDLIVGKRSEVVFDANKLGLKVRVLAILSDQAGKLTVDGLFVVRTNDPAQSIRDLGRRRILFGPEESDEKHTSGLSSLEAFDLAIPVPIPISSSCNTAALAVFEKEADAAVISSYAIRLLEGCGAIDKGSLRIVGRTDAVPFITLFATDRLDTTLEGRLSELLQGVRHEKDLLAALESKSGFVLLPPLETEWTDWRGANRAGLSDDVPRRLSHRPRLLWSHTMTGPGMAGLSVAGGYVLATDKSLDEKRDTFRCLDAETGREKWRLAYPAVGEMDFTNSPRATPVVHDGQVYLLGAFGDLHCVRLDDGTIVWRKDLPHDFDAKRPQWGYTATPLIVDDKLIVNPGGKKTSLVALDRKTGAVVWATPGEQAAYASFVLGILGGRRQIVGYDAVSLGGWDPESGRRLWRLVPEWNGDFNVPTPIVTDGKLIVATENNGTRLFGFDRFGRIHPNPLAVNEFLVPDTSTPMIHRGLLFGCDGSLQCLDLEDGLKTLWETDDDPFGDYGSLIAGNGNVLVMSQSGVLSLVRADRNGLETIGSFDLFPDTADTLSDVWSHPVLLGNRLYVRNLLGVYCFLLE